VRRLALRLAQWIALASTHTNRKVTLMDELYAQLDFFEKSVREDNLHTARLVMLAITTNMAVIIEQAQAAPMISTCSYCKKNIKHEHTGRFH